MTITQLVDDEVMRHIGLFGTIKGADPFVQHMLKKSQDPVLRFRRWWMRDTAVKQCLAAEKRQVKINDQFKDEPFNPRASVRRQAVIDPYYMADMARRHNTSWNKDFINSVKESQPAMFPRRG